MRLTEYLDREAPHRFDRLGSGFAAGLILHVVFQGALCIWIAAADASRGSGVNYDLIFALAFVGVTQIVYLLPTWMYAFVTRKRNFALGLAVLGLLTILVNGGCWAAALS
jgi:hypothetical protein